MGCLPMNAFSGYPYGRHTVRPMSISGDHKADLMRLLILRRMLAEPFHGPTVVVTHHAPSKGSVAARYAMDWVTPAFVSDLSPGLFEVPALWVHGHTHTAFDYREGACGVVSNPRGYSRRRGSFENPLFSAGLVVDIPVESWAQGEPVSLLRSASDR